MWVVCGLMKFLGMLMWIVVFIIVLVSVWVIFLFRLSMCCV